MDTTTLGAIAAILLPCVCGAAELIKKHREEEQNKQKGDCGEKREPHSLGRR